LEFRLGARLGKPLSFRHRGSTMAPVNGSSWARTMTEDYRDIANRDEYELDCPEGNWTARLDAKAWGKSANLILYFSDVETGRKYWLSVFFETGYRARENGYDFRNDAMPGDVFELTTKKTKSGKPSLLAAHKISDEASGDAKPASAKRVLH
jgi:hypothetical protein